MSSLICRLHQPTNRVNLTQTRLMGSKIPSKAKLCGQTRGQSEGQIDKSGYETFCVTLNYDLLRLIII